MEVQVLQVDLVSTLYVDLVVRQAQKRAAGLRARRAEPAGVCRFRVGRSSELPNQGLAVCGAQLETGFVQWTPEL